MGRADSIDGVIPALLAYAVAQGGVAVIPQSLVADYFGRRSYATIQGLRGSIQMIGTIAGPVITGYLFDTTGSYSLAFFGFAGATAISMALALMAKPPQRARRAAR